ncbi:MAG TPA: glycerate kinase [Acidimicrobiales bacterium]|nr:glycerate kinase [Acidimicrobiales bacterium]
MSHHNGVPRVLAALDKFRGTADAPAVVAAAGRGAVDAGWTYDPAPMSDGGEGMLDVFGGPNRTTEVTGPLGRVVSAPWRLDGSTAVIESARACGLTLAGGPEHNDPVNATTAGVGELLTAAVDAGARHVVVGLGGSASTDGGLGALRAGPRPGRMKGVELVIACDVETLFVDAARVFGPQKGASPKQVELLERRLASLQEGYRADYGVDLADVIGAGAAGGLAGGLVVLGGTIMPGIEAVADHVDLDDRIEEADLVITGEGFLDGASFAGKVVGGIVERASWSATPVLVVVGDADDEGLAAAEACASPPDVVSLTARFGEDASRADTEALIALVVAEYLGGFRPRA